MGGTEQETGLPPPRRAMAATVPWRGRCHGLGVQATACAVPQPLRGRATPFGLTVLPGRCG